MSARQLNMVYVALAAVTERISVGVVDTGKEHAFAVCSGGFADGAESNVGADAVLFGAGGLASVIDVMGTDRGVAQRDGLIVLSEGGEGDELPSLRLTRGPLSIVVPPALVKGVVIALHACAVFILTEGQVKLMSVVTPGPVADPEPATTEEPDAPRAPVNGSHV